MQTAPAAALTHLAQECTTLALCWRLERTDGVMILGTEHDRDLVVAANTTTLELTGTYFANAGITGSSVRSTSDMSVDNVEVNGAINQGDLSVVDLSAADIEAGLFDDASVTLFFINWEDPDAFQIVLRCGTVGEITRTSDGAYRTELRGLTQYLSQNVGRSYGSSCDAEFGDARCKKGLGPLTITGTVTAVTSNRQFAATLDYGSPEPEVGYFNGGLVYWTSGENESFSMEVRRDTFGSPPDLLLFLPMPLDIEVGDTFLLRPGCDKTMAMCKTRFDNLVNFRGHGAWVPGVGELMVFGGQTSERRELNALRFVIRNWEEP